MNRLSLAAASLWLGFGSSLLLGQPAAPASSSPAPVREAAQAPAKPAIVERWYVLMIQGQRAGYMKSVETTTGDRITTSSDMHMEIKRGPIGIKVTMQSEFVETPDGRPISMSNSQALGAMVTKSETVFTPEGSETKTTVAGQTTTKKSPAPKDTWLPPAAAERYVNAELAKGSKEIVVKSIDPTAGEGVITVTRKVVENANVEVFGRTVPAVKWEYSVDKFPGVKSVEYVDAKGETLKSVTNMGGISMEQLAADKDLAMSTLDAPELLMSTTVRPSRPLTDPRHLAKATYRVSVEKDEMPVLPTVAGQRFTLEPPRSGLVEQDAKGIEPVAAAELEAVKARYLEPSSTLNSNDPEIVALVKRAEVAGLKSAAAAEKLRRFVKGYVSQKDMSVGFATASEVARTQTGDCTEHAVLLGAMLRAAGVPSRCASGLVYVDEFGGQRDIFGYHMWTQALVEQEDGAWAWVNVDATLPSATPYDAAHILLSVSGLGDGEMQNFLVTTAPLIGRLKIEVVETK